MTRDECDRPTIDTVVTSDSEEEVLRKGKHGDRVVSGRVVIILLFSKYRTVFVVRFFIWKPKIMSPEQDRKPRRSYSVPFLFSLDYLWDIISRSAKILIAILQ